ncbi:hypothetical protein POM88_022411 [Heracleum sosnowskyi]|uniref:Transmembrane 9 superfamily member n=1 Tax=Heracleum sosnowskyi TaxID=360622 RepID=A0AAD8MTJ4_9APIA|nr:hypothetical protein POM88_022411 [Heracleum sosnowskyi]
MNGISQNFSAVYNIRTNDSDICIVGLLVTFTQRWANDSYGPVMGFHGLVCWLFLCTVVQNVEGNRVEEKYLENCFYVSRYIVFYLFYSLCLNLGEVFLILYALIWEKSSGAVPFGTTIALVCLWFGILVPLVFVGSYLGFKKPMIEDPVKTNKIPKQVPE